MLQVPPSWLRKKAAAGAIPHTRIGRHLRFSAHDLHSLIDAGQRGPRRGSARVTTRTRDPLPLR
ncbi:helix-turn-helix domain-containing protein [Streptomyces sp. NPDC056105]|uniref:helix-turn-helix domain-containing protein n=1 Tax=Streptomyces sp. NPDC056105 TaxID=3345714 RepID=UPI0035E1CA75